MDGQDLTTHVENAALNMLHLSFRLVPFDQKAAGGLDVLLDSVKDRMIRLGASGNSHRGDWPPPQVEKKGPRTHVIIDLPESVSSRFYAVREEKDMRPDRDKTDVCNGVLWMVHHGVDSDPVTAAMRYAYVAVNEQFAQAAMTVVNGENNSLSSSDPAVDGIVVHDYHLMRVGRALREDGYKGPLGFFLHIPFPGAEARAKLSPEDRKLFWGGLTAFDSVGFQSETDRKNFLEFCSSDLGVTVRNDNTLIAEGRTIRTGIYPAGIDPVKYEAFGHGKPDAYVDEIKQVIGDRKPIFFLGRADVTKGIHELENGLALLFRENPGRAETTVAVIVAPQTRQGVKRYADYREAMLDKAQDINDAVRVERGQPRLTLEQRAAERVVGRNGVAKIGFYDGAAVVLTEESARHDQSAELAFISAVGITPSLAEGFGLVVSELRQAANRADPLVTIMGKGCGAANTLGDSALIVDPRDERAMARVLVKGLDKPREERVELDQRMLDKVHINTAMSWYEKLIAGLMAPRGQDPGPRHSLVNPPNPSPAHGKPILEGYRPGRPIADGASLS